MPTEDLKPAPVSLQDLGLGERLAAESTQRIVNHDGSYNVLRHGVPRYEFLSPYHTLLTMSWGRYYALVIGAYIVVNFLFAFLYTLCGPNALEGSHDNSPFFDALFFSVQTLATIGYGRITPVGLVPNLLAAAEALVGLLGFSFATALLFARFSRPVGKILFSNRAVIAPYRGGRGFMFRVANGRNNQLSNVQATVSVGYSTMENGRTVRKFHMLPLERDNVILFPLHWVVVHPIDESSPFHDMTPESWSALQPEVFAVLTAHDETFSQTVQTRNSYRSEEIVWGARFANIFLTDPTGRAGIDLRKLHDIEPA